MPTFAGNADTTAHFKIDRRVADVVKAFAI
jgi:hypothetical protein